MKLNQKGRLEAGADADMVMLHRETMQIEEVIAKGRRFVRNGSCSFRETFLESSNREIKLRGDDRMRELYSAGALIAGTSSGASVMAELMLVSGEGESSPKIGASISLAPGLGLISGVIIDQHFAEQAI